MDLGKLKKLLDDFQKANIKSSSIESTFMDISGFPHYENVCSNILSFFFLTEESHGLKDLLVQALFKTIEEEVNHDIVVNKIDRELTTDKRNRIDIVIQTDEYVIGIENKIYNVLNNDLYDYSSYLNTISKGRKLIMVILSIDSTPCNGSDFVNIRYKDFFNNIDKLIGNYWQNANPKFLIYLKDFMLTIRRIGGDYKMDNELSNFLNENSEETKMFLEAINVMKKILRQRVEDLSHRINYDESKCKRFFWRDNNPLSDDLVHDINVDDAVVAIDTFGYPVGWSINIWIRKKGSNLKEKKDLVNWFISKGFSDEDINLDNSSKFTYSKEYSTADETAIHLQEILDKLCR